MAQPSSAHTKGDIQRCIDAVESWNGATMTPKKQQRCCVVQFATANTTAVIKRLVHNSYFEDQRDVDSIATSIMDVNITEIRKNSSQSLSPSPPASTTSNRKSFLSFIKARKQHHIYKRKQSMQDIDQRLGEPEDVSLADIRENGLNALLRSKVSLAFFLYHSLEEYCCENLASIQKRERENDEL